MQNNQTDMWDNNKKLFSPLAERMRPTILDDFCGQEHVVGKNMPLYRAINANVLNSCIFWGPPGTGKTTLANIIANTCNGNFVKLNAVSAGVADVKKVIEDAKYLRNLYGKKTFLLLDECHRFNKTQLDSLLAGIENGEITFIGSTTENPSVAMTSAIISRCSVYEFKKLTAKELDKALERALTDVDKGLGKYNIEFKDNARQFLLDSAFGDVRTLLNIIELAVATTQENDKNIIELDIATLEQCIQKKKMDVGESLFYDILSAFCKSLRGSDCNAVAYYLTRLLKAGCDPLIIARRIIAHASEDVGLADSNAMVVAVSAMTALKTIGMPEANLSLMHAALYVAKAPKSNSVYMAIAKSNSAIVDDNIPPYLKDSTYADKKDTIKYLYPHNFGGYVKQQYLPDKLKDEVFYIPSNNGEDK